MVALHYCTMSYPIITSSGSYRCQIVKAIASTTRNLGVSAMFSTTAMSTMGYAYANMPINQGYPKP